MRRVLKYFIAAAAFLPACGLAATLVTGSWSSDPTHAAFVTEQITFSCTGTPTCTGTYTDSLTLYAQPGSCSNTISKSWSGPISITGLNLSAAGPISGNMVLGNAPQLVIGAGNVCSFTTPGSESDPYQGSWDGTNGTFGFGPETKGGKFTATTTVPPFQMSVSSSINETTATASAQFQPRSQDVGTNASVFVFAHVPQSRLNKSQGKELKDGPDPCVLVQLNSNGQFVGASGSSMQAATTGVLNAQGQSVTILNNVATPNVAGATFYVGYGTSATTMLNNGIYQGAVSVPGNPQCTATLTAATAPSSPGSLTGLFWNANESGWGIHFTQRGAGVFAAWYTYDAAGNPKWYVSTCLGVGATGGTCNGTLYEVTGPNFFGGAFNPSLVNAVSAGNLQLNFSNANAVSMTYSGVSGQTRTVALTRQPLATGTTPPAVDFSDIWWAGSVESGWGMAMAQQYGLTFLAWYVYDSAGKPTWLVATCTMSGSTCSGTLYRTTGPAFGPTFNPNAVNATAAGTVNVNFTDANNAVLSYTVGSTTDTKIITRQLF